MESNDSELNYNIGVLIILLLMFWFVCNNIKPTEIKRKEPMSHQVNQSLNYGGNPIKIGSSRGLKYIHSNKNGIVVPNSQTSMRELFDNSAYKCQSLDTLNDFDSRPAQMFLNKRKSEGYIGKKTPRSLTSTRYKTF
jgi:hypothetical protein